MTGPRWFRHRAWIPVAWLLCLVNLGAVWFAARPGEPWHATIHAVLAVLFGLGARHLAGRATAEPDVVGRLRELETLIADPDNLAGMEGRLAELEERLDFTERALADVRTRARRPPDA